MLAYVYTLDKQLSLQEKVLPEGSDQTAVMKVTASSICGTDLRTYRFGSSKITPPRIIGHEAVGILTTVGKHVTGFSEGDRVQIAPAIGCGQCYPCSKGHTNLCDHLETIGFQYDGTFAEYLEIPQSAFRQGNVSKIERQVSDEEAVLAEPIACVVNAQQFLHIQPGEFVAIFGAGFIGCMHAKLAALNGAEKVFMIEVNPIRAKQAQALNPNLILLEPSKGNLVETARNLTDGRGMDVAIVACSVGSAQVDAMNITAKLGRVSLFGGLPGESKGFLDSNIIHYKEISVYGVHASTPAQNRQALKWISEGTLDVSQYSRDIFMLEHIEEAFQALQNEKIMKAIIKPG
jgi:L-iditol 2-dehydrogenase